MIQTRKDLQFYIAADRIMNGFPVRRSIIEWIRNCIDKPIGSVIVNFLCAMRYYSYYKNNTHSMLSWRIIPMIYWHRRWNKLSLKLGFSIGANSLGYGVVIPHHGTIVVNENAYIGNYAVLHTCTCIAGGDKIIGDYLYLSTGCQVVGKLTLGDGVTIAAHSLVNKPAGSYCLIAGTPAELKRAQYPIWPERDGDRYIERVKAVENLKLRIYAN